MRARRPAIRCRPCPAHAHADPLEAPGRAISRPMSISPCWRLWRASMASSPTPCVGQGAFLTALGIDARAAALARANPAGAEAIEAARHRLVAPEAMGRLLQGAVRCATPDWPHTGRVRMSVEVLRAANLGVVPHGFLGRRGGVSTGLYAGLNVGFGSDDEREAIVRNRALARDAVLPGSTLVTVHQVHSPDVVTVHAPIPDDARPKADALVTDRPGLLLGVLAADCVPILFADAARGIVGAAHSGWKGALHGVGEATIDAMVALGAARGAIACAIGPASAGRATK